MGENDDLLPDFLAEASDIIEKIYGDLDKLPFTDERTEIVAAIFRHVHTLKGGSSMFGFNRTHTVAHELESHLSHFKESPQLLDENEIQYIREEVQKIEELLKAKDHLDLNPGKKPQTPSPTTAAPPVQQKITSTPAQSTQPNDDFIRVPVNRVNETMNSISEIFLVRNQLVYLIDRYKSGQLDQRDFFQNWDMLDGSLRRGVAELERTTMSMRLMSVQSLFSRMARVVQGYSSKAHKKIIFQTVGENTELDKKVLDTLGEPLIHLIRNAMDHGIESPADRIATQKSEAGTITLSASILGNEAIIEVKDDGKGMDPKKILASAQRKGLDTSQVLQDQDAINLIFLPGFSTAETVTDVSGRGVGMDAVKTSVESLGGKISINTAVGKGSAFVIRLPLSMSLVPAVLVNIKGLLYAIPTSDILEIKQLPIRLLKQNSGKNYISFRGQFARCIDLREVIETEEKNFEENMRLCSVVFFQGKRETLAARISKFETNTEIVVKPMSKIAPKLPWVYGVSVLPTGESIFVLSLKKIIDSLGASYAA